MRVIGIDGWTGGWVGVLLEGDGALAGCLVSSCSGGRYAAKETPLLRLLEDAGEVDAITIDVPLGLVARGKRQAEVDARGRFGLGSSVFWTPPHRAVTAAGTQGEATVLAHELDGPGASAQFWAIRDRVLEARSVGQDRRLHEVHPELSFRVMAQTAGRPVAWSKKRTWAGVRQRLRLLRLVGVHLLERDAGAAGVVPADDLIDAAAAAWTARRVAHEDPDLVRLGGEPDADLAGVDAAIVA